MSGFIHCPNCRSKFYAFEGPKSCSTCKVDLLPGEYQRPAAPVGFEYQSDRPLYQRKNGSYMSNKDVAFELETGR